MISASDRQRVLAKLINACNDLEDALNQSVPGARYDPVVIPQALRNELSVLRDELVRIIRGWRRVHNAQPATRVIGVFTRSRVRGFSMALD